MERYSLEDIEQLLSHYSVTKTMTGENVIIDYNNKLLEDKDELTRIKFALAWKKALTYRKANSNPNHHATREQINLAYSTLMNCLKKQLEMTGNIDVLEIKHMLDNQEDAQNIITGLFSKKEYVIAVDNWGRLAYPDALDKTDDYHTIEDAQFLCFLNKRKLTKNSHQ